MKNIIILIALFWVTVIQVAGFVIIYRAVIAQNKDIETIKRDIGAITQEFVGVRCN